MVETGQSAEKSGPLATTPDDGVLQGQVADLSIRMNPAKEPHAPYGQIANIHCQVTDCVPTPVEAAAELTSRTDADSTDLDTINVQIGRQDQRFVPQDAGAPDQRQLVGSGDLIGVLLCAAPGQPVDDRLTNGLRGAAFPSQAWIVPTDVQYPVGVPCPPVECIGVRFHQAGGVEADAAGTDVYPAGLRVPEAAVDEPA